MHNVDVESLLQTVERGTADPALLRQPVELSGEWQTRAGAPQFQGRIPYPGGEVEFSCDFPPPLGGSGSAPNPLAYCLWGGLACYAMTFATEAAREGVELRALRGVITTEVDQSRSLGLSDRAPVDHVEWHLDVDAPMHRQRRSTRSGSRLTLAAQASTASATRSTSRRPCLSSPPRS